MCSGAVGRVVSSKLIHHAFKSSRKLLSAIFILLNNNVNKTFHDFSEKAPVGGISVKEIFEINLVPLTIGVTYMFFKKLMAFCFPEKSASNNSNNDSNSDEVAVTKEKKKKGLYCSLDDSFKKPDVVVWEIFAFMFIRFNFTIVLAAIGKFPFETPIIDAIVNLLKYSDRRREEQEGFVRCRQFLRRVTLEQRRHRRNESQSPTG